MCGIAGLFHFDRTVHADWQQLRRMTDAMVHRGPDDQGLYLDRHVGLGHRRLSIIDRAAGHQPMPNEDETVWITFNGEIYNFREIREELVSTGHRFRTQSDTEVILHLYEDLEEACVSRLHGMFAFAIWDRRRDRVLLARDPLGIKPLYYRLEADRLAFSSEIRPLLTLGPGPRLDLQGLHQLLTFRYTVAPQTTFQGIRKLPPGHLLTVRGQDVSVQQYWDLDCSKKLSINEDEAIEEFGRRLRQSTRSHLVGEVPHGVLLSGGLDSTAIAAVVAEYADTRVQTFSVGFEAESPEWDDRPYARLAARFIGTEHHEVSLTAQDYLDHLPDYIRHVEEPMADPSAVPLYCLSRLARQYVTVILSGEGSDELLAGYSFWDALKGYRRAEYFRRLPRVLRQGLLAPLNHRLFASPRLARYLTLAEQPVSQYLMTVPSSMTRVFSDDAKAELYSEHLRGLQETLGPADRVLVDGYRQAARFSFLDQMLYVYSKQWMPDDLLLKADKMTMAHSLELRVPFLDTPFVEFMASLPTELKMRKSGKQYVTKYILRKAIEGRIPSEILTRRKVGFPVPLRHLLDHGLIGMAHDLLGSGRISRLGLFNRSRVELLLRQARERSPEAMQVWSLLVLALWVELFEVSA